MPNYFEISPTNDALNLQQGNGAAGFTVRYMGERSVEAKAEAVALQGAQQSWLQVAEPTTKEMQSNQTQTFKVLVNVPSGTPAGRYGLRLDVMSVDNTDEEYNQGPVIAFEVGETSAPPPKKDKGFPWWIIIVAAVILALLAGGGVWWLVSRNGGEPQTSVINFNEATAGKINADAYLQDGITGVTTNPKGNYCTGVVPFILPAGLYRLPETVLSTALSGNSSHCNGVELVFELQQPATHVSIAFFGANTSYKLTAYDSNNNVLGSDTASSIPYNYNTPSIVTVSSEEAQIDHFEFGSQGALTLIHSIEITTIDGE